MHDAEGGLLIYARGGHEWGLGHVRRAITLADALRRRARGPLGALGTTVVLPYDAASLDVLRRAGTDVAIVSPDETTALAELDRLLSVRRPTVVIHDALASSERRMAVLRRDAAVLVTVDDASPSARHADLVINALHAPAACVQPSRCRSEPGVIWLDPRFTAARSRYRARDQVRRLLVSQGGADTFGNVPQLVHALRSLPPGIETVALVGAAFRHDSELRRATEGRASVTVARSVDDVAALFATVDLAISGGGVSLFELAAIGVPTIALTSEPRELETIERFVAAGAVRSVGLLTPRRRETVAEAASELVDDAEARAELSGLGRRLIDGRGVDRFLDELEQRLTSVERIRESWQQPHCPARRP